MAKKASIRKSNFPLLDHADSLVEKLHKLAPAAFDAFDSDGIHAARVATRRLSAALDLMEPVLSKAHRKPLMLGLKKLRRRLGPLRDADVMIDHLDDLAKQPKVAPAARWLAIRLSKSREAARDESRKEVSVQKYLKRLDSWPRTREEVAEARDAVDSLLAESLHLQTDQFAEQANRLAADLTSRRVKSPMAAAAAGSDSTASLRPNPHDVRIAGKALRYTLEMADIEGHSPGVWVMRSFKQIQEQLGAWHDFVVLADSAMSQAVSDELAHLDPPAAEQALDLARYAIRESTRHLAGFARLWTRSGPKIVAKIQAAFPLTQDVSHLDHGLEAPPTEGVKESETDPDPSDSASFREQEEIRSSESPAA